MDKFFTNIFHKLKKHQIGAIFLAISLFFLLGFVASKLKFEEDITRLIPKSEKSDITNKVLQHVNFADKIIIYLEAKNNTGKDELTNYASELIDSLEVLKNDYIDKIQGKIDNQEIDKTLQFIYQNIPLFLNANDYQYIERKLAKDSIETITKANYKTLISPTGIIAKQTILKDPLGITFLGLKKLEQLKVDANFNIHNGFLITNDGKNLLLFIVPKLATNETDKNTAFVEQLYKIQETLNKKYQSKVSSEYYGATVVAVANANQIKHDIQFTISIALTILVLILIFFYKKIAIPIILFVPTIFGALFAIAILYLIKGQISAISLGIGSVLLGITLDYALHILTHYKNNGDINQLYKDVTKPILMSSITTAVAFLCLLFLKSEALQDLGIFASVSVLSSSIFALLFIPQAYRIQSTEKKTKKTIIDRIAGYTFQKNKILIGALTILFLTSLFTYKKVIFDQDISKMNFQTAALKSTEKKLDTLMDFASKSIYVTTYGNTIDQTLTANNSIYSKLDALKKKGEILNFSSIGGIVLSKEVQNKKIEQWQSFWNTEKKKNIQQNLIESGAILGFKPNSFHQFYQTLNKDFKPISLTDYKDINALFLNEFITETPNFSTAVSMVKVKNENLEKIVAQFDQQTQTIVIDRQHINETFLGNLKTDFNKLIGYSLIAVLLILLFFFRSITLTLITSIPIALTWILTIGIMGLLGISFNIFNIIISTFIFGLGIDYSIFITNGLLKKHIFGVEELPTYKTSILLSVITTILGVGVLIFAKHPALYSISIVSIIGIVSAMLISFTIQPLLFNFVIGWRTKRGLAPLQIRTFLHALILFTFYGLGGMLLSIFSITILPIIPISKKKKMKWLHHTMAKLVTAVLYGNPFVKKQVINPHGETFEKPAVIISNHSSFLDTLTIGMATPNVIYLVNDWVYKSPVFGLLAKVAGFYPVSSGVDGSLEHLKEKIRQGYCLVVFPEARRSFTNKIGRFHKGAFFLAEQLELDILPLYLHGNAEVLPKKDFIIYDGSLTVKIGQRIPFNDKSYGSTSRERTKKITTFYKEEFNKLRHEIEQVGYFKDILYSNYRYKGSKLFQHIKNDYQKNKFLYKEVADNIPLKSKIAHFTNTYGQLDILLVSRSLDRKMTTFIIDENKRIIASNCYTSIHRKINFVNTINDIIHNETEILLISGKLEGHHDLIKKISLVKIKEVLLINNDSLIDYFKNSDFIIQQTKGTVIHLKK